MMNPFSSYFRFHAIRRSFGAIAGLFAILLLCADVFAEAPQAVPGTIAVHKRLRVPQQDGSFHVQEKSEAWQGSQTAVIVCDVWDAHHCLNAVRRGDEMAPRMNQVLETARQRGAFIIHAPSGCMEWYKNYPGRKLAMDAPSAANLPKDIGTWCYKIPAEEKGVYPINQKDGGEDDDPEEHRLWHERLAGMGRNPKSPWKHQTDTIKIHAGDAISDSGVEIWNLLEQRGIQNVVVLGVHTNMCVLGRPFGLRQMSKNGKNVVLMRDMTDTMYNPERWPYVTHFVGTDLIVEHIEKFVCPTITSADLLGGAPFRFRNDRRNIVMIIGDDEYKTEVTLPAFAKKQLEPRGFHVTFVHADEKERNDFPGLIDALKSADVVLVSARRRTPPTAQLDALRAHLAAGKPLVGIRTASHAFSLRNNMPPADGFAAWNEFDSEVLGGHYTGHHGAEPQTKVSLAPGADKHPILRLVDVNSLVGNGSLYLTRPLAGTTSPILLGEIADKPIETVAWTNSFGPNHARVFYTSFGHVADFENPAFQKLLLNGICWACELAPPADKSAAENEATGK